MSAPDLSPSFYDAWTAMAARLGVDPLALARVSFAETGMYRRHPRNAAAGVWPFIESTLHLLGWQGSAVDFTAQEPEAQIVPWMERYLQPYRAYLKDDAMVYVAMFLPARLPAAFASDDSFVMTRRGDSTGYYEANQILDRDGDGVITVGDLRRHMDIQDQGDRWQTIESELRARGGGQSGTPTPSGSGAGKKLFAPWTVFLLAAGAFGTWYLYATEEGVRVRQNAERRFDSIFTRATK